MNLQTLTAELEKLDSDPPFDQWHPPYCGEIDMIIKADGSWWYMGSPIGREPLKKLFASVLLKEGNEYFLKTPAEKVKIQVEDAPFVVTQWHRHETEDGPAIEVVTNLDHRLVLSERNPLTVDMSDADYPRPYVKMHRNLSVLVHRNVYYQWLDIATQVKKDGKDHLMITSGKHEFSLGYY